MAIGSRAPKFSLPDTRDNQQVSLSDHKNKPVLIVFMCNHCPYVVHLLDELAAVAHQFASDGITTITISSNDSAKYPQDGPEKMGDLARQNNWQFPYCFDESQTVAQAYGAVCTPDIFLFDADHDLYYHGQFDETRPGHGQAHGGNLKKAAASLLAGKSAPSSTHPSVGCSIKWKD
ncbi:MAG: peroxiredoxin [Pseudomonadales bacterium]|jgi:peroxiredoxin